LTSGRLRCHAATPLNSPSLWLRFSSAAFVSLPAPTSYVSAPDRLDRIIDANRAGLCNRDVDAERERLRRLEIPPVRRQRLQRVEVGHACVWILRRHRTAADVPQ